MDGFYRQQNLLRLRLDPWISLSFLLLGLNDLQEDCLISIIDMKENIISTARLPLVSTGFQYILPLEDVPSGIYLLSIYNGAGQIIQQHKFISQ